MSLIDSTYFINDINIPARTYSDLETYITKFEAEYLRRAFGYSLATLIAAYNVSTSPQRIKDIVEGAEFEYSGYTQKWNGLTNTDLISPIAYYIYYNYTKDKITHTTTTGEVKTTHENSDVVDSTIKMKNAWNNLVQLTGNLHVNPYNSLYFFMRLNQDTYPEWQFMPFTKTNSFDI